MQAGRRVQSKLLKKSAITKSQHYAKQSMDADGRAGGTQTRPLKQYKPSCGTMGVSWQVAGRQITPLIQYSGKKPYEKGKNEGVVTYWYWMQAIRG